MPSGDWGINCPREIRGGRTRSLGRNWSWWQCLLPLPLRHHRLWTVESRRLDRRQQRNSAQRRRAAAGNQPAWRAGARPVEARPRGERQTQQRWGEQRVQASSAAAYQHREDRKTVMCGCGCSCVFAAAEARSKDPKSTDTDIPVWPIHYSLMGRTQGMA